MNVHLTLFSTLVAFLITACICYAAYKKKWLSLSGSFAAFLLGVVILLAKNILFAIPMLVFFMGGSLLSKLPSTAKQTDSNAKKPRNATQVFCNGGMAGLCIALFVITGKDNFLVAYFISIAVSASDTFSSELGNYFRGNVYDITNFKKTTKGLSGGISVKGTLAGLAGAGLIACCYYMMPDTSITIALMVAVCGFAGMLMDSMMGSLLQAKFMAGDSSISEEKNAEEFVLIKGVAWVNNDLVNLLSNALITLCALLVLWKHQPIS